MENIIVVDCISTGINFIQDIINRGFNPVVLELKTADTEVGRRCAEYVLQEYEKIDYEFDIIYERDTFEETLEEVRKYDPLLILPGNEKGVILATRLSHELGLLGNPVENLDAMTMKDEMHNRLAEKGLRSIKGRRVKSLQEALDFYDSEGLGEVVIKPIYGAGSSSVRICLNREELIRSIEEILANPNYYGERLEEFLVQERINGEEYIVNTVSHNGIPRVTLMWKYNKVKTGDGAIVYDSCETVNDLTIGEAEMVEYAYSVADAIGIKYGPVHGEYMLDEKGPVLIEVNCRPCGGDMSAEFLDRISGQHETDSILDSYLRPEHFKESLKRKYKLYAHGTLKFFIVPKDMMVRSAPVDRMVNRMKSYYGISLSNNVYDEKFFKKTVDLVTSGGIVYLVHEDKNEVDKNLDFLRSVEKNAFELILSSNSSEVIEKEDEEYVNEIAPIIRRTQAQGAGLLVTDQFVEQTDMMQISYEQIDDVKGNFDFVVINLNRSLAGKSDDEKVIILLDIFSKVKTGGDILIPKNTYMSLSTGRRGMEALIKVLDYKIQLPPYTIKEIIVATRTV